MSDDLVATLRAFLERLTSLGIEYMLVGSVAALAHGRARTTQDFDIVVQVDERSVRALVAALPVDRFYVSEDAALDAVRRASMFNVIDMTTGWKIDVIPLKRRPFSVREFERRARTLLLDLEVYVASVEDVILAKLEWSSMAGGSERQLDDVRELCRVAQIDRTYLESGARELGVWDVWSAIDRSEG